jgi:hypothetical protein
LGVKSFKKTDTKNKKSKAQLITDAKGSLYPKRDHIIKQTARLGLFTKQLSTQEIIELFYDIYNPAPTGTQRVILDAASYTTPLVEPDLETPTPAPAAAAAVQAQTSEANTAGDGADTSAQVQAPPPVDVVGANPSPVASPQPIVMPTAQPATVQAPIAQPSAAGSGAEQQEALKSLQDAIKQAGATVGGGK